MRDQKYLPNNMSRYAFNTKVFLFKFIDLRVEDFRKVKILITST